LFSEKRNRTEAQQFCQSLGGNLVTINGKEENAFIYTLVEKTGKRTGDFRDFFLESIACFHPWVVTA